MDIIIHLSLRESERLDKVVFGHISPEDAVSGVTRSQVREWIKSGRVAVNGRVERKPGRSVKGDMILTVEVPGPEPARLLPYDFPLDVLYEDESIIVLNKPAGLSMHPGAGNKTKTLVNALIHHCPDDFKEMVGEQRPGIVHRLDKDTTGVVVAAKNARSLSCLQRQFMERSAVRRYVALTVSGPRASNPLDSSDIGTIEGDIGRDPVNRLRMAVVGKGGRAARTHWHVLERFKNGVLVELKLDTGRTHQIRVHLSHIRSPVVGDPVYGDDARLPFDLKREAARFGRQALHAGVLEFTHPTSKKRLSYEVMMPSDMEELVAVFRGGK